MSYGGEGGIRTLERPIVSVSCRCYVASAAIYAMFTGGHCPLLPAGVRYEEERLREATLADCLPPSIASVFSLRCFFPSPFRSA